MLGDKGCVVLAKDGRMLGAESKNARESKTASESKARESAPNVDSALPKNIWLDSAPNASPPESKVRESKNAESARPRIAVLADFDTTKRPRPHHIIALLKDIAEVFVIAREQSDESGAHCFAFPAPAENAATRSAKQKARITDLCQKGDFAPLIYTPNRAIISDILRALPRLDLLIVEDIALLPFACDYKREVLQADSITKESATKKAESTQTTTPKSTQSNALESTKPAESTKSRALDSATQKPAILDSTTPESALLDSALLDSVALDSATHPAPKIICDLREFYPLEYEDEAWQAGLGRFFTHLCARYLKEADLCLCVSEAICARYVRDFGIAPRLYLSLPPHLDSLHYKKLRNAAQKRQIRESTARRHAKYNIRHHAPKTKPIKARILYHGFISRDRDSLNLLRLARLLGDKYKLHCMVVCNDARFLRDFCARAKRQRNIRIIPPVPMSDIIAQSVGYDIGILTLQPNSFNNAHAMPNKLFEYIQSRLCVISTPIPSVRAFLRDFGAGRVASDFSAQSLARTIRAITCQRKCYNSAIDSATNPTARQSKCHQNTPRHKRVFRKSKSPLAYRQTLAQHFCKALSLESNRAKLHQILRELNIIP
ncbi:hypothetical protein BKN38_00950 [Helicobacter sp. CLO-3]|uniref:hypothetical protein n=1 Tax=unclassified Helicobacter TaxID=2593540 RepID=UPI000805A1FC|nr:MULTISPECIES: hypothetical protein [unclassified Helicobacter]OBV29155.1 hypothetical protein BA723_06545 [Helicobacter sp. CLO-3]OHU85619.1 hypothetical protein BKN38_00950 [Helicobacter sp. CLO-3]